MTEPTETKITDDDIKTVWLGTGEPAGVQLQDDVDDTDADDVDDTDDADDTDADDTDADDDAVDEGGGEAAPPSAV
jgi:hypothetical protein